MTQRSPIYSIATLVLAALLGVCGCKEETKPQVSEPRLFESETAGYSVTLPGEWKLEPAESLNTFADLAAQREQTYFLIVIPQKLPDIPGVSPPDALALRRASVAVMEEQIEDFTIDRRGPIKLADSVAQSLFAHGTVEDQKVKYVTTYATRGSWGYQIVAWGPYELRSALVTHVDRILASWTFTNSKPTEENNILASPDMGGDARPDTRDQP